MLTSVKRTDSYGRRQLVVWAAIMGAHSTVFGKRSMTGLKCMDDLFVLYITFFKNVLGPDFILMAYNVRRDRAHLVREFLKM